MGCGVRGHHQRVQTLPRSSVENQDTSQHMPKAHMSKPIGEMAFSIDTAQASRLPKL